MFSIPAQTRCMHPAKQRDTCLLRGAGWPQHPASHVGHASRTKSTKSEFPVSDSIHFSRQHPAGARCAADEAHAEGGGEGRCRARAARRTRRSTRPSEPRFPPALRLQWRKPIPEHVAHHGRRKLAEREQLHLAGPAEELCVCGLVGVYRNERRRHLADIRVQAPQCGAEPVCMCVGQGEMQGGEGNSARQRAPARLDGPSSAWDFLEAGRQPRRSRSSNQREQWHDGVVSTPPQQMHQALHKHHPRNTLLLTLRRRAGRRGW